MNTKLSESATPESRIARMYGEILGIDVVDPDADFFALGGNSLRAMQLLATVNEAFSTDLQFSDLIDHATPRAIAQSIVPAIARDWPRPVPAASFENQPLPITRGQLLFWRLGRRKELASYFNLRQAFLIHGTLDLEALRASLQALADRHESLRLHFRPIGGAGAEDAELVIPKHWPVPLSVIEPDAARLADPHTFVRELLQKELDRPFDLLGEPLIRFKVVRFSATLHAFLVTMHHLITDAWSFNVLRRELNLLYTAHVRGRPNPLPALPLSYSEHARRNQLLHESESCRRESGYWQELFASLRPFRGHAPLSNPDSELSGTGYADLSISSEDVVRLEQRSAAHHTTPYVLLQVLMHLALYSAFPDLSRMLVMSPANDRHRTELQDSIGLHITIIGVTSSIAAGMTLRQFIAQMKRSVHEALEHYESRQFGLYDLAGHQADDFPIIVYNYFLLQNDCGWALDELQIEPVWPAAEDSRRFVTMLELYHARGESGLWGQLKYDFQTFGAAAAQRFIGQYKQILAAVLNCTDDDVPVARLIGR
jgi:acyl carrier protein